MKRQVARKKFAADVVAANITKGTGPTQPGFAVAPDGAKFGRVSLLGTVKSIFFDRENQFAALTLADGTGEVPCRAFREDIRAMEGVSEGDLVRAIGKPKVYDGKNYVLAEIVKKLSDPLWAEVQRIEAGGDEREEALKDSESPSPGGAEPRGGGDGEESDKDRVLRVLTEKDTGEGVKYLELHEEADLDEDALDNALNGLLTEGEIYEPKIGRFKSMRE